MNVIFFDIDGVLNCGSPSKIDKDKAKLFSNLVTATNSILVLISPYKEGWERGKNYTTPEAKYIDKHLLQKGHLRIADKTRESLNEGKGAGIRKWLNENPDTEKWIVIDSNYSPDYEDYDILPNLLSPVDGLTEELVQSAIIMMSEDENEH